MLKHSTLVVPETFTSVLNLKTETVTDHNSDPFKEWQRMEVKTVDVFTPLIYWVSQQYS